jgi:hypothetical protein
MLFLISSYQLLSMLKFKHLLKEDKLIDTEEIIIPFCIQCLINMTIALINLLSILFRMYLDTLTYHNWLFPNTQWIFTPNEHYINLIVQLLYYLYATFPLTLSKASIIRLIIYF